MKTQENFGLRSALDFPRPFFAHFQKIEKPLPHGMVLVTKESAAFLAKILIDTYRCYMIYF